MASQCTLRAVVMVYAPIFWSCLTSFELGIHGHIVGVLCWPFLVIQLNSSIAVQQRFWWDPGDDQCLPTETQSINGLGDLQMHYANMFLLRRKGGWFYCSFSLVVCTSLLLASTYKSSRVTMDAEVMQMSSWQFNKVQLSFVFWVPKWGVKNIVKDHLFYLCNMSQFKLVRCTLFS